MKRGLISLLLLLLLCSSVQSAPPQTTRETDIQFHHELEKATLAVYERYPTDKTPVSSDERAFDELFGLSVRSTASDFTARFICTATVVGRDGNEYALLSAGHCFTSTRPNLKYYISEGVSDDPVLQHVDVVKSVTSDKYDFALLSLESPREYPVMTVSADPLPPVETPLVNVNFSFGMVQQLVKGFIGTGIMKKGEGDQDCYRCAGRFIAELGVAPGASGSAIVDDTTRKIIGVTEAIFPGYTVGTIVIPTGQTLDDFMVDNAITEKLPPAPKPQPKPVMKPAPKESPAFIAFCCGLLALGLICLFMGWWTDGSRKQRRKYAEQR